jgi:outer membrane protein TolC
MTTEIMHQPTPEFRDYLEGEITREYHRHRSFARLRFAAILLATLAAGTTAGLASAQIRESAQRDSLLQTAQSDLAMAALRLQLAQARLADLDSKFQAGVVDKLSMTTAESELRQMEAQALRAKLNIEEIRASSLPPRDELNAPLAGGRDFVTERITLDLFTSQQRMTAAEQALAEAERQFRVGAVPELAVQDAKLELTRARAALGTLAERRKLRKEFIEQGTAVDQLNRRFQQAQVRSDAMVAQEAVSVLRQRLEALEKQRAIGTAEELDVLRAKVELLMRELELQSLTRQLRELAKPL